MNLSQISFKKTGVAVMFLGLILAAALFFNHFYQNELTAAEKGDALASTGTVEAETVKASFKVAGKIHRLLVDEGDKVEKGQEIAILDSQEISAKVLQAKGAYQAAKAQADQAKEAVDMTSKTVEAKISQVNAKIAQAKTDLKNAQQTYDRVAELHAAGVASDSQMDEATNNLEAKKSQLNEATAGLEEAKAARASVEVAQAQYEAALGQCQQAEGALAEAEAYLENTHLKAPISGYITEKYLQQGEMVNAGTPVLEICDVQHTYVKVFISETKVGRVALNQQAEVKVDAFPDKVFSGRITWINNAGDFAVKKAVNEMEDHDVRSFEVKVDIPNPDLALKTGMTATVEILEEGGSSAGSN